ncbi:MAG TPA: NAD(P)/FAD-dependent oxidoreductase [Pseudonocardiaceae bacterium]|jgi:putative flavoprotein involved in K+ transport
MTGGGAARGPHCPPRTEHVDTVIVGGGQTGLTVGYHLARRDQSFVILDANERIGDSWRQRWDSLRLFTPARYNGLPDCPFPGDIWSFPTKDEMADYLQAYAARFGLPIRSGVHVDRLCAAGNRYVLLSGTDRFEADNVVVAMGSYQRPVVPESAAELDPGIVQLHSADYRNPTQLRDGGVLVVGAGNSGVDIALDIAGTHHVWISGRHVGHLPVRIEKPTARLLVRLVLRLCFHRVLIVTNPVGRIAQQLARSRGGPLIRVQPRDLVAAGIERVPRVVGAVDGQPMLADQRVLPVSNLVWCTGFKPDFSWIDLPGFGSHDPWRDRGVIADHPGLYFVGLFFLYALSSSMIHGVERDAAHIAQLIAARQAGHHRHR